jgi:hypothetical protein
VNEKEANHSSSPSLWTERPTGAVMGASNSLWPFTCSFDESHGLNLTQKKLKLVQLSFFQKTQLELMVLGF